MSYKNTYVRIPETLHDRLTRHAKTHHLSVAAMIRFACESYCNSLEFRPTAAPSSGTTGTVTWNPVNDNWGGDPDYIPS